MTTQHIMDDALPLLEKLAEILDSEQKILLSADLDALDELVVSKQALLEKLATIEPKILTAMNEHDGKNSRQGSRVADLLELCRQRNSENHALTAQGIKNINHSISFLHSVMQTGTVDLYDPSGNAGTEITKRDIGRA